MDAYIDLANLRAYAKSGGHEDFKTCTDMLRQNFNLCFTFDKGLIQREKKQAQMSIMNLIRQLTSNRGDSESIKWNVSYPPRPLSEDVYETMDIRQLTSIYLLDDENIKEMVSHGCLLFSEEGNEIKTLENLLVDGKPATKAYALRNMSDWSLVENNASPCTDIVVIDPYLFAQSDLLYEYNSYKILESLAKWNKSHALNIVIFTFPQHKDGAIMRDVPFVTIERQLKSRILAISGVEPKLTFVKLPPGKEHDRTIITNYKMFDSGDSFKYFNDQGENTSHGRWFHVHTHGDKSTRGQAVAYLQDLQELIDDLKSGLSSIIGDKKSNFLNF